MTGEGTDDRLASIQAGDSPSEVDSSSNELQERALEFDGSDDYVTVPADDQLRLSSVTVELWFKAPEGGGLRVLTSRQGANYEDRNWWLTLLSDGRIWFKPSGITTSDSYEDDKWHHVAAVLDPENTGKARLYVDGQLEVEGDADTPDTPDAPMIIGAEADNYGSELKRHFSGGIAEVRLWNDVRSGTEIREHMEKKLAGDEAGLVGYWPLKPSDPGGDDSGNGHDGTVEGDPQETLLLPFESDLPEERNVVLGETITLGPVALRYPDGTVSYQWYRDGEAITGATGESLTIEEVTGDDTGTYHVRADDARELTPVQSHRADVQIDDAAHFETDLPDQRVVTRGSTATLGPVELKDPNGEVSYQWYWDGEPIPGATESSLTLSDVSEADFGAYFVEVEDGWETPIRSNTVDVLDEKSASIKALAEVTTETPPDEVYAAFNRFCRASFGAQKEPLIYEKFGDTLEILDGGSWQHVSETSAVIAWETNLPAEGSVAYGKTEDLSQQTDPSERPFYTHVQYLTGLEPDTTYYYRPVVTDERGNTTKGPVRSFTTATPEGDVVRIPEELDGPPYDLTQADTTYVLTADITAEGTAIRVPNEADAADVTLDLNGHTVVYNNGDVPEEDIQRGIKSFRNNRLTIVNGTVKQGNGTKSEEHRPVYVLSSGGLEIAGVTADYHTPQTDGIRLRYCGGDVKIHHNVFLDRGTEVTNRDTMVKALRVEGSLEGLHPHHNLVKRTRQTGIDGGFPNEHNEVYVDSWPVNSFALQLKSNSQARHNRLFGTGVNPFGTGWSPENQVVKDNLVQFQGIDTRGNRKYEGWGEQDALGGFRVTSYNSNTDPIKNNQHENNLVLINARDGSQARGTGFWSDPVVSNVRLTDSTIKVEAEDEETPRIGCVATQGDKKEDNNPVVYADSELLSNLAPIRFGDGYGQGWNHHFKRCTLRRTGDDDRFHTFVFDGGYDSKDHVILDCEFGEGTSWDDVWWKETGTGSEYTVKWTLTLQTQPNADVEITDTTDETVFTGTADSDGNLDVPLTQGILSRADDSSLPTTETDITTKTPHTVTVSTDDGEQTETVEMTDQRTLDLSGSEDPALTVSGDTISPGGTATLSVDASSVETITLRKLWTDWTVQAADAAGAATTDRVSQAGEFELTWNTVQSTVAPSLTVQPPADTYVGGTYVVEVVAERDGTAVTDTALVEVSTEVT